MTSQRKRPPIASARPTLGRRALQRSLLVLVAALAPAAPRAAPCDSCERVDRDGATTLSLSWRGDRALSPLGAEAASTSLDADQCCGPTPDFLVSVAWEDRSTGDGDVHVATTRDGGCSWTLTQVTSGPEDDRTPGVAVEVTQDLVVVVFSRDGTVHASRSTDGGTTFSPPEQVDAAGTDPDGPPKIAAIRMAEIGDVHLHVTWGLAGRVHHARSFDGGATGSWVSSGAISEPWPGGPWLRPDVTADTRSVEPRLFSAVGIVAEGTPDAGQPVGVHVVRSNDSGNTFFGDPTDTSTRDVPRRISDAATSCRGPVIDTSDDGSGAFVAWTVAAWTQEGAPLTALADSRAEVGRSTDGPPAVISEWNDAPESSDLPVLSQPARAEAVAIRPNPLGRPPQPEVQLFAVDDSPTPEIHGSLGLLTAEQRPSIVVSCEQYQVTGIDPPREAGSVVPGSVSADEDHFEVYLAWLDTRDGAPRVLFKRTDVFVSEVNELVASPLACAEGVGLVVQWTPSSTPYDCDIDHYRIGWGPDPDTPDEWMDVDGSETRLDLTDLLPRTEYWIRIAAVDEACNESEYVLARAITADCGPVLCPNPVANTLRLTRGGDDVQLAWQPPEADAEHSLATSYLVYRSVTVPGESYLVLRQPTDPTSLDPGAARSDAPGRIHHYLIVARNACGTSGDEPPP